MFKRLDPQNPTIAEGADHMKEGDSRLFVFGLEPAVLATASGVVAIDKPAGLPTQAPPGIDSAETWLRRWLAAGNLSAAIGYEGYVGVPHRLDRPVSGVLLLAATPRAARKLSRQFERRQIEKTYLAILAAPERSHEGLRLEQAGTSGLEWRDFIEKIPVEPRARVSVAETATAREAVTRARLIKRLADGRLLVELAPLTGRMHQLRLQASARGLPVVGDPLYGGPEGDAAGWAAPPPNDPRALPIALHAWRIRYTDPDTLAPVAIEAPPPAFWPAEARV
jgi:23S rRNA pseudouridine1911/1915/1917 synthase